MHSTLHTDPLAKSIEAALRDRCAIRPGDRLLLGVSGGADSIALMLALRAIARRGHWALDLRIAHIQHHLRPEAEQDAAFVAELAARLGLEFHRRDADVPAHALAPDSQERNIEAAARKLRYQALMQIARSIDADFILTAHQADDQLETMLMRMIRGSSATGMAAMAWVRRIGGRAADPTQPPLRHARPMLRCTHQQAIDFLTRAGQTWREDTTNQDRSRLRARLRAEVLPILRDIRPDAAAKAHDTAEQLAELARMARTIALRSIRKHVTTDAQGAIRLPRGILRGRPGPIAGAIVRSISRRAGVPADQLGQRVIKPILLSLNDPDLSPRRFDLAGAIQLRIDADHLIWTRD